MLNIDPLVVSPDRYEIRAGILARIRGLMRLSAGYAL